MIRISKASDISRILELYAEQILHMVKLQPEFFKEGNQTAEFMEKIIDDENSRIFLYCEDEEIQGFLIVQIHERKKLPFFVYKKYAYVLDIFVAENHRQKGIGKLLMDTCAAWAKEKGADFMELDVLSNNESGISFYEKLGFEERRRVMFLNL